MTVPNPFQGTFTCGTCHSIFESSELQRTHYQSDWHRYNLRRKVSDLPPVTEIIFKQRLSTLNTTKESASEIQSSEKFECSSCRKVFSSENAHLNHLKSRKHLELLDNQTSPPKQNKEGPTKSQPSEENNELYLSSDATEEQIREVLEKKLTLAHRLQPEECIFCSRAFESFEHNMEHMTKQHGLYIPDLEFIGDLPGLMSYLADKVAVAHCCLYCPANVQPFSNLESVRRHMTDKGHLKIRFDEEGMQELADFYNYESFESDDGDEEFEDVSGSDLEYVDDDALIISPDETELILPSGKRLGHRAYRKYYKQNIPIEPPTRISRRGEYQALISQMSDHYFAVGLAKPAEHKQHTIEQRHTYQAQKDWDLRMGMKNNGLQEYFRYQLRQ